MINISTPTSLDSRAMDCSDFTVDGLVAAHGQIGIPSGTKVQTAHAKVEIRLVDVRTGYVFFTASGAGDASTESGEVAGLAARRITMQPSMIARSARRSPMFRTR